MFDAPLNQYNLCIVEPSHEPLSSACTIQRSSSLHSIKQGRKKIRNNQLYLLIFELIFKRL